MRKLSSILVTGGAGFIGSHFVDYVLSALPDSIVVNMDAMTYAASMENNAHARALYGGSNCGGDAARCNGSGYGGHRGRGDGNCRYYFEKADITDMDACRNIMERYNIDTVVHFAAESHVDRSIASPAIFALTNVVGTQVLLEAARKCWTLPDGSITNGVLFHHVSTDEVYGPQRSASAEDAAREYSALRPSSPYAATKAASDLIALSWARTYGIPVTISRCCNNYGRRQYPEKFLPLMIGHIKAGKRLPVYGNGMARRNWLHVSDHVRAILCIMTHGQSATDASAAGEESGLAGVYNIAAGKENILTNIDMLHRVINIEATLLGMDADKVRQTIDFVTDRKAHDALYSMDTKKIAALGWKPTVPLDSGLLDTIKQYIKNSIEIPLFSAFAGICAVL